MTFNATVWIEDGWIKVRWPWHRTRMEHVREEIKSSIPKGSRKFSPDEKCWHVDVAYDAELMEILERLCDEVVVLGDSAEPAVPAQLTSGDDPSSVLLSLCPDKTLPKVWRAIAGALHPDSGGDEEVFKQANAAWEALRTARGV